MIRIRNGSLVTGNVNLCDCKVIFTGDHISLELPVSVDDLKGLRSDAGLELKRRKQRIPAPDGFKSWREYAASVGIEIPKGASAPRQLEKAFDDTYIMAKRAHYGL